MAGVISIRNLSKTYASGFQALKAVDLEINKGEIFALLGPNGAGKTTLISIICGLVSASTGQVLVDGHDIATDYRAARSTWPVEALTRPQMMLIRVVLPAPLGPSRAKISPFSISRSTAFSAWKPDA